MSVAQKICTVEGCNKKVYALGYCQMHYLRVKKHNNSQYICPVKIKESCTIVECSSMLIARGLCNKHYIRKFRKPNPEYGIWRQMIQRCYNERVQMYKYYGGKGVKVCDRWLNSFENFRVDMGLRPTDKHSIDRKDTSGNYEPDNCKWATKEEQMNNRSSNQFITKGGVTRTMVQWSRALNVPWTTIQWRLRAGWSEDRLLIPSQAKGSWNTKKT